MTDQIEFGLGVVAVVLGMVLATRPAITKWLFDHTTVVWASRGEDPEAIKRRSEAARKSYDSELSALRWMLPGALVVIGVAFIAQVLI